MVTIDPQLLMKLKEKVEAYPEAHVPTIRLEDDYAIKYWDGAYHRYVVITDLEEEGNNIFLLYGNHTITSTSIFYGPKGREILGFIDELFFTSEENFDSFEELCQMIHNYIGEE